jgi:ABC-type multidrug transport system fused ATPase/permease subunit
VTSILRIWGLLSPALRARAVGLVFLMAVAMLLEMIGLGMIVPALGLMTTDAPIEASPFVASWLTWLGNPSRPVLVLLGLLTVLALYIVKAGVLIFSGWRQIEFVRAVQRDLSSRLFAIYLAQPWVFHLQHNPAILGRNIGDVGVLASLLTMLLATLADLFVMAGVVALLIWFEPVGAIAVACVLALATVLMERVTRARLRRWGREAQRLAGEVSKHLTQSLHGAKDIKVRSCEASFVRTFTDLTTARGSIQSRQSIVMNLPRLWFEIVAVMALCALTASLVWQGKSTTEMVPSLGLFAAAAFRLLPSANKLALGFQALGSNSAVVETLSAELALPVPMADDTVAGNLPFRRAIEFESVTFRYPTAATSALADVRLTIPHGTSVGLIGGSGAGKSTLVDIVLGLLQPTAGRVLVDGADIGDRVRQWQRRVGYVPQAIYLCDDTIRANVAFGLRDEEIDDKAVTRALAAAQLAAFVSSLPDGADTVVGDRGMRLSGGQRQRIGIARALYHDPELLVLDEATSALDNETEHGVMEAIESLHGQKTLLIVAHRLTTVERCDLIYKLEGGRVLKSGTFAEVVG